MTRFEIIKQLEKIKDEIISMNINVITDYTREKTYINIEDTIELLKENEE